MSEQDRKESADVALLLENDIIKRVGDAMLKLISGQEEVYLNHSLDEAKGVDLAVSRMNIADYLMDSMKVQLQQLIRQEIVDAFANGGGGRTIGYAEELTISLQDLVLTQAT